MIRYNEFLVLLKEKIKEKSTNKDVIFELSGRVRVGFDPKFYRFFGFESRK